MSQLCRLNRQTAEVVMVPVQYKKTKDSRTFNNITLQQPVSVDVDML